MTTQVLLVPGFWLGAWAWEEVVPHLRDRGLEVTALTLPGLEPGSDPSATLEEQADAIAAAVDPAAERVVLVVHSGATVPGCLAVDRDPARFARVVFVDTAPVVDGFAVGPDHSGDVLLLDDVWEEEFGQGSMRDLTDEQLATFRERAVPQPGATVHEPVRLASDERLAVPGTVICTAFPASDYQSYAGQGAPFLAGLLAYDNLDLVDLPTGHWPMWSRPAELADLIGEAAHGATPPGS
ncbi:alpha/beta fold hydrolase [Actinomycetota bacterium]